MKPVPSLTLAAALLVLVAALPSRAVPADGGNGIRSGSQGLTRARAARLLDGKVDDVLAVERSEVAGLWVVDVVQGGRKFPIYMDATGQYVISGRIIRLRDGKNLTEARFERLNAVDVASVPLDNSIVIGNPRAKHRIIVFADPDCPYCARMHAEEKKLVAEDKDVAFFVKVYARNGNPRTIAKVRSILCAKKGALKRLDDAFAGVPLPPAGCPTTAPEETARLAATLHVAATPTMILPDGRMISGYRNAQAIRQLLAESASSVRAK